MARGGRNRRYLVGIDVGGTFTDCDLAFSILFTAVSGRRLRFEVALSAPEGGPDG